MRRVERFNDLLLDSSSTRHFMPIAVGPVPNSLELLRGPRGDACLRGCLCRTTFLCASELLCGLDERRKCGIELVGVVRPQIDLVVGTLVRESHTVLKAWIDRLPVEIVGECADESFGHVIPLF